MEAERKAELSALVDAAARDWFAARRALVPGFVARHFGVVGALRLHRRAFGWDLARAPVNVFLAVPQIILHLTAALFSAFGFTAGARRLRAIRLLLPTDVTSAVERLIATELLGLGPASDRDGLAAAILSDPEVRAAMRDEGVEPAALDETLRSGLADYAGARSAVAEMTAALATLGAGAMAFQKVTPGAVTLGPVIAAGVAHSTAIASFPLGATLGAVWYDWMTPAASPELTVGVTLLLMLVLSVVAAFAGVVADPLQTALGMHQRRLRRLIDALERRFFADGGRGFAAREQYVARLIDLIDVAAAAATRLRG